MRIAWPAGKAVDPDHRVARRERTETEVGARWSKDRNGGCPHGGGQMLRSRIVAHDHRASPNELGRPQKAQAAGRINDRMTGGADRGADLGCEGAVGGAPNHNDLTRRREGSAELGVVGPSFRPPCAPWGERDQTPSRQAPGAEQLVDRAHILLRLGRVWGESLRAARRRAIPQRAPTIVRRDAGRADRVWCACTGRAPPKSRTRYVRDTQPESRADRYGSNLVPGRRRASPGWRLGSASCTGHSTRVQFATGRSVRGHHGACHRRSPTGLPDGAPRPWRPPAWSRCRQARVPRARSVAGS